MEIKTKYDVGDEVFHLHQSKVITSIIKRIDYSKFHDYGSIKTSVEYTLSSGQTTTERYVFSSKEELLKSL